MLATNLVICQLLNLLSSPCISEKTVPVNLDKHDSIRNIGIFLLKFGVIWMCSVRIRSGQTYLGKKEKKI